MPKIYYKNVKFRLRKTKDIKNWIIQVIRSEKMEPGDLSFIFATDSYMKKLNREFLKKDYYTDVIAFDYRQGNIVDGEIYIGIEIIKRNARIYNTSFLNEVVRVMVHGVLHIIGYDDKNEKDRKEMREREDFYIRRLIEREDGI